MKKIVCFLFGHNWSGWRVTGKQARRTCRTCPAIDERTLL